MVFFSEGFERNKSRLTFLICSQNFFYDLKLQIYDVAQGVKKKRVIVLGGSYSLQSSKYVHLDEYRVKFGDLFSSMMWVWHVLGYERMNKVLGE